MKKSNIKQVLLIFTKGVYYTMATTAVIGFGLLAGLLAYIDYHSPWISLLAGFLGSGLVMVLISGALSETIDITATGISNAISNLDKTLASPQRRKRNPVLPQSCLNNKQRKEGNKGNDNTGLFLGGFNVFPGFVDTFDPHDPMSVLYDYGYNNMDMSSNTECQDSMNPHDPTSVMYDDHYDSMHSHDCFDPYDLTCGNFDHSMDITDTCSGLDSSIDFESCTSTDSDMSSSFDNDCSSSFDDY